MFAECTQPKGDKECKADISGGRATFLLPLDNIYACGTIRVLNKITGDKIFYHRIIVEYPEDRKEVILVKCVIPGEPRGDILQNRTRRNVLPENFSEPEYINITDYIVARTPVPFLNVALRQDGQRLDTTINVEPGTPLEMLIYLDEKSTDTYGILASYLKVTDNTSKQEEVIVMNGCSIDSYIFGNFDSPDNGNTLSAKFRAFKFPHSNYVLFVGTVNVCLKQCQGVPCGNDHFGFGRKKREIPGELPSDPNKMFDVEMTAFLKVGYDKNAFSGIKGRTKGKEEDRLEDQLETNQGPYVTSGSKKLPSLSAAMFFVTTVTLLTR
ncbi:uncharacterized protein LOC143238139 isoform X2 [Tachypleus tridentatus]|uniref:uncharacterized protein LOC143238139 isoform X2 n=1 Tax=Tachypleus tridentatus TaxID=6853 RepID=UPI003FD46114